MFIVHNVNIPSQIHIPLWIHSNPLIIFTTQSLINYDIVPCVAYHIYLSATAKQPALYQLVFISPDYVSLINEDIILLFLIKLFIYIFHCFSCWKTELQWNFSCIHMFFL